MNRLDAKFEQLRNERKKAVIPYVCCGDPTIAFTERLVVELALKGADIIELGIPFSDPVADGPTIQKASERALQAGIKLREIFNMVARLRLKAIDTPLIIMTYSNIIYARGIEVFMQEAGKAGIDGLIIPDVPLEEANMFKTEAEKNGLNIIMLAALTSSETRLELVAEQSQGFIYCVSVTGITGARKNLDRKFFQMIEKIKKITDKPTAVGFGISNTKTAKIAAENTDGIIVGSAIIDIIEKNLNNLDKALKEVVDFVKELQDAVNC